jgi:hypothetical protein
MRNLGTLVTCEPFLSESARRYYSLAVLLTALALKYYKFLMHYIEVGINIVKAG